MLDQVNQEIIKRAMERATVVHLVRDCACVGEEPSAHNRCTGCGKPYIEVEQ